MALVDGLLEVERLRKGLHSRVEHHRLPSKLRDGLLDYWPRGDELLEGHRDWWLALFLRQVSKVLLQGEIVNCDDPK